METSGEDTRLRAAFQELAEELRAARDVDALHGMLARYAVTLVDGCDHAAVSVLDRGRMRTAAASDRVAEQLDDLQRETGEGPCIDAIADAAWEHHVDVSAEPDSPFLRLVHARTPVRSMLAFRLLDDADKRGALNLFSDTAGGFSDSAAEQAAILAAFATVATAGARHAGRNEQLTAALDSNRQIATAIGIVMASQHVTAEEAFDRLRRASQSLNRKLRDIASDLIADHQHRAQADGS